MASGKTHFIVGSVGLIGCAILTTPLLAYSPTTYFCINGGSLTGLFLTSDKDLETAIYPDYILSLFFTFFLKRGKFKRRMQNVALKTMEGIWAFYSIPFSHRHMLSHFPIVGATIRLIYLYFFIGLICFGIVGLPSVYLFGIEFIKLYYVEIAYFILGMGVQDLLHAALDGFRFHW